MNNPHRCENADQCPMVCSAKRYHELSTHCAPKICAFGVVSKCVPVNHINDVVKQGSREFCIELGDMTVNAEDHVEAVEKAARWLLANAANMTYLVGDTAELNNPIHPGMSRSMVKLTDGKGKVEF